MRKYLIYFAAAMVITVAILLPLALSIWGR